MAFALACAWANGASGQVIAPDNQPASTIDNYPTMIADTPVRRSSRPRVLVQLSSRLQYSSNILGVSNLPGGLELEGEGGFYWENGATVIGLLPVSNKLVLQANVGLSYTKYFEHSNLDYFALSGGVGAIYFVSPKTTVSLNVDCSSERDSHFRAYYELCVPSVGVTSAIGNPYTGTGLEFGARGAYALGKTARFGRYREGTVYLNFETGGRLRFQFRPEARIRSYDVPQFLSILGDRRTDYQASIKAALFYRTDHITFGVEAAPRVNWSNWAQYRYWEVRGGPFIRARF